MRSTVERERARGGNNVWPSRGRFSSRCSARNEDDGGESENALGGSSADKFRHVFVEKGPADEWEIVMLALSKAGPLPREEAAKGLLYPSGLAFLLISSGLCGEDEGDTSTKARPFHNRY